METWPIIKARHKREKIELIQAYAAHYTIYQTAKILDMDQTQLRTFAYNNRINFPKAVNGQQTSARP